MLTKQASEKIAEQYYQAGVELALSKVAGLPTKELIKKMIQAPAAGAGALAGASAGEFLSQFLPAAEHVTPANMLLLLSTIGGSSMLGAAGAGKAVDLTHSGATKLLNKLRR